MTLCPREWKEMEQWIVFNIGTEGYVPRFSGTLEECGKFILSQHSTAGYWMRPASVGEPQFSGLSG